ncbi:GDP-L-fucose synthase [Sphingomonas sp. So64.6b]|uniref:GDP-L-fucose synthase family protein n=1 Tax=Sphingomonas sp. So64.6b TaxID=2997354 RepID=UPI0016043E4F|nr:GDP-L-fucose synthase [Sphingomonas sp. So64.6b]QNA83254.1 GDP-L-fucose synthase [Sphingomonas sp. So64.6b]
MSDLKFDLKDKKIWVAGERGMVGRAIVRRLASEGCTIVSPDTRIDLRDQAATFAWMAANPVDLIFLAAAKVGGIAANNDRPGEFLYDNLMIETNVIEGARRAAVAKLVFLGSSCIFPKLAAQPMAESALLTGPLEPTNQWYAIAKIAGLKLCEAYRRQYGCDFISAQPTNLYGPFDNFDLESSHVLPALMRKAHEAKLAGADTLSVWGSGTPLREFLHVDDLADALVFLARNYSDDEFVNIGTGDEVSIANLAHLVAEAVGFQGKVAFDATRPDGTPRKLVDTTKLKALGWESSVPLGTGIAEVYRWFLDNGPDARHERAAA